MDGFLWIFLPVFVAIGSALLSFYIMEARMEVALARERESLAEARATITSQKVTMEERIKATEESTKRHAMDEFMQDFRVEERSYQRESKSLTASRKAVVMQERLFFRNIPLSNWIEREMVIEEGMDLDQLPKESVFATSPLEASPFMGMVDAAPVASPAVPAMTPQIAQTEDLMVLSSFIETSNHRNGHEANSFAATAVPAFGAQ
jgi:hypothetical protein